MSKLAKTGISILTKGDQHSMVIKIFWAVLAIAILGGIQLFVDRAALQNEITRMDEYFAKNAMIQAVRHVEPDEYQRFRMIMIEAIKARKSQEGVETLAEQFSKEFMQKRLRHGSADMLMRYLMFRADLFDKIGKASPAACYDLLISGNIHFHSLPKEIQEQIQREQGKFFENLVDVIAAPLSNSPIPQDNALATTRILEIRDTLTDAERKALNEGKPNVDKEVYCRAYIKVYSKALQLPEVEAVQVFRYLGEIPQDDRQILVPR